MTAADAWRALMPAAVSVVPATAEMWSIPATPRERAFLGHAVPRRRQEYQAGRAAARVALRALGIDGFDLLPGADRQPLWPVGIVGSITHAAGHCAAAAARRSDLWALGIDVESATPLEPDLAERICSPPEQRALALLGEFASGLGAKLLFSAKEAVYKAYFPLMRRVLDFHDVQVTIDPQLGEFVAELCPDVPPLFGSRLLNGRFVAQGDLLFTAIAMTPCCPQR